MRQLRKSPQALRQARQVLGARQTRPSDIEERIATRKANLKHCLAQDQLLLNDDSWA